MIDPAMIPGKKTERAKCNMTVYIFIIPLLPASCIEDMKKSPSVMPEALLQYSRSIPTRSLKAGLKHFCLGNMLRTILALYVLHRIGAIRFIVAMMLP